MSIVLAAAAAFAAAAAACFLRWRLWFLPSHKRNLVMITSALRVPAEFTVFSVEQRFDQLLVSVRSARESVPDAVIVVLEQGVFTGFQMGRLRTEGVMYIKQYGKDEVVGLTHHIKSKGELYMLRAYLESREFARLRPHLQTVSKLSGRYWLTPQFRFDVIPLEYPLFKEGSWNDYNSEIYETRYYRIKVDYVDTFVWHLNRMEEDPTEDSVEPRFFRHRVFGEAARGIVEPFKLHVAGYIAPTGEYVED